MTIDQATRDRAYDAAYQASDRSSAVAARVEIDAILEEDPQDPEANGLAEMLEKIVLGFDDGSLEPEGVPAELP